MVSKSFIQFSVEGQGCVPSLLFDLRPNYSGGNEDNGDLLQKVPCMHAALSAPSPAVGHHQHTPHQRLLDTQGKSGSVSCGVTAPFSWVPVCRRFCLCPLRVCFPVLCKFWQLYGGINGDLLQEGLCHTLVCCTQNPCPSSRPLLTCNSTEDTQTLKGRSGSVSVGSPGAHKVLFEPSEHLWWVWGLILNVILPLLPSCWGLSFALGSEIYFFGEIQHPPVEGCSGVSCNFGVPTEDEWSSFYCTISFRRKV